MTQAEYECIKGGGAKKYLSKLNWYFQNLVVNFMRTMKENHVKQEILEDRINQLEDKIEMKLNQEEVDQPREEIKSVWYNKTHSIFGNNYCK